MNTLDSNHILFKSTNQLIFIYNCNIFLIRIFSSRIFVYSIILKLTSIILTIILCHDNYEDNLFYKNYRSVKVFIFCLIEHCILGMYSWPKILLVLGFNE